MKLEITLECLKSLLVALFEAMDMPGVKVTIEDDTLYIDDYYWAEICDMNAAVPTLKGVRERMVKGFAIGTTAITSATYWEPEDREPVELMKVPFAPQAARELLLAMFNGKIDNAMESILTPEEDL